MRSMLFGIAVIMSLGANAQTNCAEKSISGLSEILSSQSVKINSSKDEARSGCCSHHSGVCGCNFGTIQCCDGTASPSCGC